MKHKIIISITLITISLALNAQNWPQWRGPNQNGIAEQGKYPTIFSRTDALWEVDLPGKGGSTPIVWGEHILVTSGIGNGEDGQDGVLCYDWSGTLQWKTSLGKQIPGKHPRGSGSNSSAITDGERIFVLFKSTTIAALDFNGDVLWKTNLQDDYGELTYWWDFGTSPVLADGKVIVSILHEGESFLVAFNQKTGKVAWLTERNYNCSPETAQSYTTPVVLNKNGESTIMVWGANHVTGHSASTGKLKWTYSGFNPEKKQYWRTIASPVVSGDIAIIPYGRGRFMAAIQTGVSGTFTAKDFLWNQKGLGTDVATPLISENNVYVLGFNGKLWCLEMKTGQELWQTRLPEVKGLFYSSPTLAGDKLYMCNDEGTFYVGKVSKSGIEVLNTIKFDDNFVATPVLVQDKLLIRGTKKLYCFGQ